MSPKKITFASSIYSYRKLFPGVACEILVLMDVHWCW